jgi:hypothetical protein
MITLSGTITIKTLDAILAEGVNEDQGIARAQLMLLLLDIKRKGPGREMSVANKDKYSQEKTNILVKSLGDSISKMTGLTEKLDEWLKIDDVRSLASEDIKKLVKQHRHDVKLFWKGWGVIPALVLSNVPSLKYYKHRKLRIQLLTCILELIVGGNARASGPSAKRRRTDSEPALDGQEQEPPAVLHHSQDDKYATSPHGDTPGLASLDSQHPLCNDTTPRANETTITTSSPNAQTDDSFPQGAENITSSHSATPRPLAKRSPKGADAQGTKQPRLLDQVEQEPGAFGARQEIPAATGEPYNTAMGTGDSPKSDANETTVPLRNGERPWEDQGEDQETTAINSKHFELSQCLRRPCAESNQVSQDSSTSAASSSISTTGKHAARETAHPLELQESQRPNGKSIPPLRDPSMRDPSRKLPPGFIIPERFFHFMNFPIPMKIAQPFQTQPRHLLYKDHYNIDGSNDSLLIFLWAGGDVCESLQRLNPKEVTQTQDDTYSYNCMSIEILRPLMGSVDTTADPELFEMIKQSEHWGKGLHELSLLAPQDPQKHGVYCLLGCIVPTKWFSNHLVA